MKRIAIVGGGIAGLSAAYTLQKARQNGASLEWTLFEKSDRLGGVIRTEHHDGFVLEAGPDSFLTAKPEAARLCGELGIAGEIIPSNDFQRKTYILVRNRLVPIPDGLQFMVPTRILPMISTPLFSLGAKVRMATEWFSGMRGQNGDESVAAFVRRHFGQEMVDRVAEPLLAGVYGGNAEKLSLRAVLPRFAEMEAQHGSLVRATLHARKTATAQAQGQPLFSSLKNGIQQLADALIAALPPAALKLAEPVASLQKTAGSWQITTTNGTGDFDAVLLGIPAPCCAGLLQSVNPEVSRRLARIGYTSSAAVALAFDRVSLPEGFGFLIPASERRSLLACTFVHNKFHHRAPQGKVLLRCFFSSSRTPDLMQLSEEDLRSRARQELQEILGLQQEPRFSRVFRWAYGLPQYETGHLERAAEIEQQLSTLPGLHLIGNSLYGVGLPDCIKSGRAAAEKAIGQESN
jgi:oxygen-dependent protoporphyrinogen oxidase